MKGSWDAWLRRPWVAAPIIVANALGFVLGIIYWYGGQLAQTPWYLWPFVPDCPLFAFLFIPAYLLVLWGRGNNPYNLLVAFGLIKYGVWTNVAWYAYWAVGHPVEWMGVAMCLTHLGMILEGVYLLRYVRPRSSWISLTWAWFVLSDVSDYVWGTYPRMPDERILPILQWHTIAFTWLGTWWLWRKREERLTINE
ncbi:MAG: DUF1405 domain-containing protein [Chloroflexi bacterium]|nr:DUF1405 domain-containing protein [Chloroflexota bacterium]